MARLFVKTAFAYLAVALGLGVGLAVRPAALAAFGPAHVHLLVVGWLTQLIFGVAYWLFPRHSKARPYGAAWAAGAAFVLLNGGLVLRAFAEPAVALGGGAGWRAALVGAAAAQALGALAFVGALWPRVRTK